ncbi:MAG: nucleotidyltransferase family protein [Clostridiales bacterium]|nr:nucleotidyltransferase family protein [Clostridiales bacterium]
MKCIILAAGYATRLYPLTENFPKPLLSVGDKAILDYLVDDAADTGRVDGFIVVTNHKFAEHFKSWAKTKALNIEVVDDKTMTNETRLGAVRDILYALEETKTEDDLLVMAGDNILDFSLKGFIDFAKEKNASCVMCHEETSLKKLQKTGVITTDENSLITSYEEKPQNPKGHLAVPPFYVLKKDDAALIEKALENGCGADAPGSFASWLSRNSKVYAYVMPGKRYDIGDIESYEYVKKQFERK